MAPLIHLHIFCDPLLYRLLFLLQPESFKKSLLYFVVHVLQFVHLSQYKRQMDHNGCWFTMNIITFIYNRIPNSFINMMSFADTTIQKMASCITSHFAQFKTAGMGIEKFWKVGGGLMFCV